MSTITVTTTVEVPDYTDKLKATEELYDGLRKLNEQGQADLNHQATIVLAQMRDYVKAFVSPLFNSKMYDLMVGKSVYYKGINMISVCDKYIDVCLIDKLDVFNNGEPTYGRYCFSIYRDGTIKTLVSTSDVVDLAVCWEHSKEYLDECMKRLIYKSFEQEDDTACSLILDMNALENFKI